MRRERFMVFISIIILLFVVLFVYKKCFKKGRKIEVNHVLCFSVGYVFYCIVPILMFSFFKEIKDLGYNKIRYLFSEIPGRQLIFYLIISFALYISFALGVISTKWKKHFYNKKCLLKDYKYNYNKIEKIFFYPILLLGVFLLYICRESLGVGYRGEKLVSSSMSAYQLLLNGFVIMFLVGNDICSIKKLIFNKWTIWLFIYSCFLLTTGGRLYVVTSLLSELIFYSCIKKNGFKIRYLLVACIVLVAAVGVLGLLRLGISNVKLTDVIINIFSESIFTNWSNITYIKNYNLFNLFGSLKMILSGFINLIPSVLFENKVDYLYSVYDMYPFVENPLGATHFFVTYNGGLGFIPSILFFYLVGRGLEIAYSEIKNRGITVKTIYCLVTANLMFTLFRDPFATSIVKNIFEFSIIIPWAASAIGNKMVYIYEKVMKK